MTSKLVEFNVMGDERGQLIALEENKEIPFDIKRVFYIFGTKENIPRGEHSHYKTKQFLVAVNGSCKVTLDNGQEKKTFDLNNRNKGLFQEALIWGTMHSFSEDCVLMVLANDFYDSKDYITDYNVFLKEVN
ncbi:sugar 3,4-ketoisomerase [Sulfurimonas sp. CS5]|uniref:sugar 3,4-ketoisomerase n=1 Tax=Sulfurimonas sp. CS5 TaxID=3391145 RepID=UPI0039E81B58